MTNFEDVTPQVLRRRKSLPKKLKTRPKTQKLHKNKKQKTKKETERTMSGIKVSTTITHWQCYVFRNILQQCT